MNAHDFLNLVGILGGTCVMLTPVFIVRLVLRHREKLTALQNKVNGSPALIEELAAMRQELSALRETTTRFDMSFDAALSRVENRLHSVEQNQANESASTYTTSPPYEETQTVSLRR